MLDLIRFSVGISAVNQDDLFEQIFFLFGKIGKAHAEADSRHNIDDFAGQPDGFAGRQAQPEFHALACGGVEDRVNKTSVHTQVADPRLAFAGRTFEQYSQRN